MGEISIFLWCSLRSAPKKITKFFRGYGPMGRRMKWNKLMGKIVASSEY